MLVQCLKYASGFYLQLTFKHEMGIQWVLKVFGAVDFTVFICVNYTLMALSFWQIHSFISAEPMQIVLWNGTSHVSLTRLESFMAMVAIPVYLLLYCCIFYVYTIQALTGTLVLSLRVLQALSLWCKDLSLL